MTNRISLASLIAGVVTFGSLVYGEGTNPPAPSFAEVYSLVQSNLADVNQDDLNRAAVTGLLSQLQSRVTYLTNGAEAADAPRVPLLSKSAVFEGAYGFLRIGRVGPDLSNEVAKALNQLRSTNKLKGVIVDLRFAVG